MASGQSGQGPWVQKSGRETSSCWSQLGSEARNKNNPPTTTSSGGGGKSSYSTTISWGFCSSASSNSKTNGNAKRPQDTKDKSGPGPLWF